MTEKRFTVQSSYLGLYTIFDGKEMKPLSSRDCVDLLNAQHEENQRLKKAEILANYRGEMVGFATALLDDLGSQTMREMWREFREEKYREWRELE